ncbi:MAG: hypothetical protein JWM25_1333, partial [Thermoleophilia bacterium]|nr:hypothetical protein [Thermoleophilia bacterium]
MVVGIEQFGMMENPTAGPIMMDTQRDYGAKVIRYIVRWDWVAKCDPRTKGSATDPNNACYDFSATDYVTSQANARGMQVLLSIWGAPKWVHNNPSQSYVGRSDAQFTHFVDRFAEFSQAATTRYDGRHGHGRVTQWTIWNEPNGNFFEPRWEGTKLIGPARYARLYDTAARRIKAVDPTLRVAVGPTAPLARELPPITFMEGVLPLLEQWKSPIDAWGHNAYIAGQSPFATTITSPRVGLGNIKDLTDELDQYSVTRDKPIWITEFGYRTGTYGSDAISTELQAIRTADALRFAWLNPRIETFIWYSLQDEGGEKGFNSGLFHPSNVTCSTKLCPKPAALVFQRTLWLSGRSASGAVVVWGQSRVDPAATKIFVQAPGEGWRAYANADTAQTGTVEAKLLL